MASNLHRITNRPPSSKRECLVVFFAALTLGFTAWGFAGVMAWTLHVMLIGGILTLSAAIVPVPGDHKLFADFRRLTRFPPFWFSLIFLIYILIQWLNPALMVKHGDGGWWIEYKKAGVIDWLPSSVQSGFEPMNALRVIELFAASFFLMWGIWIGTTRRVSILIIFWVFVMSGSAMGFVAILQHLVGSEKVLWIYKSANPHHWGSFFYRNHAVGYLNLIIVASGYLYFYYASRTINKGSQGGPHFILFFILFSIVGSVFLALSRGGIIFASILSFFFLLMVAVQKVYSLYEKRASKSLTVASLLFVVVGFFLVFTVVDTDAVKNRFEDYESTILDLESTTRGISSKATWDMAKDSLWFGWGAGSFRYVFPIYQRNYPEIFFGHFHKGTQTWRGRKIYRYAHNDILQFISEYGLVGCGILMLMLIFIFGACLSSNFHSIYFIIGMLCVLGNAYVEFILNSPAYWMALMGFTVSCAKLRELESSRRKLSYNDHCTVN